MKQSKSKLRFKRKTYGWGWTPVSRQGRVSLIVYLALVFGRVVMYSNMAQNDQQQRIGTVLEGDSGGNLVVVLVPIVVFTVGLLLVCYKKGETPKRQWGNKTKSL